MFEGRPQNSGTFSPPKTHTSFKCIPFEEIFSRINTLIPLDLSFVEALLFLFFGDDHFGYLALSRSSILGDSEFEK
jgi:hypothetical protein